MIGIATDGLTYGTGYGLLNQEISPYWWQMSAKQATLALSAMSGIPGGIFSPTLAVAAAVGR